MKLHGDNTASLILVDQPLVNERSKHIDIAYHYVRDLKERNLIAVEYVTTKRMIADGLTKPLPKETFELHLALDGFGGEWERLVGGRENGVYSLI